MDEFKLHGVEFHRGEHDHWLPTLPQGLPAGEYWVMMPIQGHDTPAYDFGVR